MLTVWQFLVHVQKPVVVYPVSYPLYLPRIPQHPPSGECERNVTKLYDKLLSFSLTCVHSYIRVSFSLSSCLLFTPWRPCVMITVLMRILGREIIYVYNVNDLLQFNTPKAKAYLFLRLPDDSLGVYCVSHDKIQKQNSKLWNIVYCRIYFETSLLNWKLVPSLTNNLLR